jgi:hypothetical protein
MKIKIPVLDKCYYSTSCIRYRTCEERDAIAILLRSDQSSCGRKNSLDGADSGVNGPRPRGTPPYRQRCEPGFDQNKKKLLFRKGGDSALVKIQKFRFTLDPDQQSIFKMDPSRYRIPNTEMKKSHTVVLIKILKKIHSGSTTL